MYISIQDKIINFIQDNPGTNTHDVRKYVGVQISAQSVSWLLANLRRRGIIDNKGAPSGQHTSWHIHEEER